MFVEKIFADNLIEKFKEEIIENHQSLCDQPYIPIDTFRDKGVAIPNGNEDARSGYS